MEATTISVLVKGRRCEAARAAGDRGIPFVFESDWNGNTAGLVPASFHDKVAAWFCEAPHQAPHHAPFPAGTVLHYSLGDIKVANVESPQEASR